MKNILKKFIYIILILNIQTSVFSINFEEIESIKKTMRETNIIPNFDDMTEFIKRDEFAKIVISASKYKNIVNENHLTNATVDVGVDNIYSPYVKLAIDNNLMNTYLGGKFKPKEILTYYDVVYSTLSLLSYTNDDFLGDIKTAKKNKFIELELDKNISDFKNVNISDPINKTNLMYVMYNLLKTKPKNNSVIYGKTIFDKLTTNEDGEINATDTITYKLTGPYIYYYSGETIDSKIPFDVNEAKVYLNGSLSSVAKLNEDLYNYQYIICSFDENKKTIYAYSESSDVNDIFKTKKAYVTKVNYSATSQFTPVSVELEEKKYYLSNELTKLQFSYTGDIKINDQIIVVYTDVSNKQTNVYKYANEQEDGTVTYTYEYADKNDKDEEQPVGSIFLAIKC